MARRREGERVWPIGSVQRAAVIKIEGWWLSIRNKRLFRALKFAVCSAEHSLTHEILRKLSPQEAALLKDPSVITKVKFRLDGTRFPPSVVFKIFSRAQSVQYLCGKNIIQPTTKAAEDARQQMGNRLYFDQLLSDCTRHYQFSVSDLTDIGTIKDYMKYTACLDETPAEYGGKGNHWRHLDLDILSRYSARGSVFEVVRPVVATAPLPKTCSTSPSPSLPSPFKIQHLTSREASRERGSQLAQKRVRKMRKSFTAESTHRSHDSEIIQDCLPYYQQQEEQSDDLITKPRPVTCNTPVGADDDNEILELYQWTQELSIDDLN